MRTTKASAAVDRLRRRSGNVLYSMSCRADGLFSLLLTGADGATETIGSPLPLDDFVRYVNDIAAVKPKPVSKLDAAFRSQLKRG